MFKQADNLLGKDLRVSYVADNGNIVKSWTVRDGKVTSEKDSSGNAVGYYYFWSNETGYVQIPVMRTCLLYTSPSPRDRTRSRMPSSA